MRFESRVVKDLANLCYLCGLNPVLLKDSANYCEIYAIIVNKPDWFKYFHLHLLEFYKFIVYVFGNIGSSVVTEITTVLWICYNGLGLWIFDCWISVILSKFNIFQTISFNKIIYIDFSLHVKKKKITGNFEIV